MHAKAALKLQEWTMLPKCRSGQIRRMLQEWTDFAGLNNDGGKTQEVDNDRSGFHRVEMSSHYTVL